MEEGQDCFRLVQVSLCMDSEACTLALGVGFEIGVVLYGAVFAVSVVIRFIRRA